MAYRIQINWFGDKVHAMELELVDGVGVVYGAVRLARGDMRYIRDNDRAFSILNVCIASVPPTPKLCTYLLISRVYVCYF